MVQENKIKDSDWAVIESITSQIYPDEYDLTTRKDREVIRQSIENGTINVFLRKEGGDLNADASFISMISLGFSAIQTAISYLMFLLMIKQIRREEVPEDIVGKMLEDEDFNNEIDEKAKNELLRIRSKLNKKLKEIILKINGK